MMVSDSFLTGRASTAGAGMSGLAARAASFVSAGELSLRRHQCCRTTVELKQRIAQAEQSAEEQRVAMERLTTRDPFIAGVMADMLRQREEMVRLARVHLELEQVAEMRGQREA